MPPTTRKYITVPDELHSQLSRLAEESQPKTTIGYLAEHLIRLGLKSHEENANRNLPEIDPLKPLTPDP